MNAFDRIRAARDTLYFSNGLSVLLRRLVFATRLLLYRLGPLNIIVDHEGGDPNGSRMCLTAPLYRNLIEMLKLPPRPLTILDIGAQSGGFTLLLMHMGFTLRRVIAVEMHPATYGRCCFNLHQNLHSTSPCTDVSCIHAACVGQPGPREIIVGAGSTGDSIYSRTLSATSSISVRGITVSEIFGEHLPSDATVDLCKMDIEGAEYEVLCSRQAEAIKRCRHLIIEIHGNSELKRQALVSTLRDMGFTELTSVPETSASVHAFTRRS